MVLYDGTVRIRWLYNSVKEGYDVACIDGFTAVVLLKFSLTCPRYTCFDALTIVTGNTTLPFGAVIYAVKVSTYTV